MSDQTPPITPELLDQFLENEAKPSHEGFAEASPIDDLGSAASIDDLSPVASPSTGTRPPAAGKPADQPPSPARPATGQNASPLAGAEMNVNLLVDVPLQITVELGRSRMTVKEILDMKQGSVVELNRTAGDPVDIFVNDHLVARGEVVVVDDNFGVRITEIISAVR